MIADWINWMFIDEFNWIDFQLLNRIGIIPTCIWRIEWLIHLRIRKLCSWTYWSRINQSMEHRCSSISRRLCIKWWMTTRRSTRKNWTHSNCSQISSRKTTSSLASQQPTMRSHHAKKSQAKTTHGFPSVFNSSQYVHSTQSFFFSLSFRRKYPHSFPAHQQTTRSMQNKMNSK